MDQRWRENESQSLRPTNLMALKIIGKEGIYPNTCWAQKQGGMRPPHNWALTQIQRRNNSAQAHTHTHTHPYTPIALNLWADHTQLRWAPMAVDGPKRKAGFSVVTVKTLKSSSLYLTHPALYSKTQGIIGNLSRLPGWFPSFIVRGNQQAGSHSKCSAKGALSAYIG